MKKIIASFVILISVAIHAQDNVLSVTANTTGAPASVSFSELQNIFLGNQPKWSNGDKVLIALMKLTTAEGKATCDKLYRMSPDQVTKHWLALSIRGTIDAPLFFNTAEELQRFVSANPGAIGISANSATLPNSKTVLVDGKKTF